MAYSEGGHEEDLRAQADTGAGAADQMGPSESDDRSGGGASATRDGHVAASEESRERRREAGENGEAGWRDSRDDGDRLSKLEASPSPGADTAASQGGSTSSSQGGSTSDSSTNASSMTGGSADTGGRPRSFGRAITDAVLSVVGWVFGRDDDDGYRERPTSERLRSLAKEGYELHQPYCSQSVSHVAEGYGITELSGMPANEQVAYMQQNWSRVEGRTAQALANNGSLVIAGLAAADQGHTAVATPGAGAIKQDGKFYPNVTCGGPPDRQSDGTRTAGDVWIPSDRSKVEYFVPKRQ